MDDEHPNAAASPAKAATCEGAGESAGRPRIVVKEDPSVTKEGILNQLRQCYDPEIPVNLVDLGLVYDVVLEGNRVDVKLTLTAPGCHLGGMIAGDVQNKLLALDGVDEANVELVWDPPWHQGMIAPAARLQLGLDPA